MKTAEDVLNYLIPHAENLMTGRQYTAAISAIRKLVEQSITADRENLINNIVLNVDGVASNKDYIVDACYHYSETYIKVDKDSIINAPKL